MLPTSLKPGRQEHFTPLFAPVVPLFRTSGALWTKDGRKMVEKVVGVECILLTINILSIPTVAQTAPLKQLFC